jgi:peptide-methionine (S)-S-oxide reductase
MTRLLVAAAVVAVVVAVGLQRFRPGFKVPETFPALENDSAGPPAEPVGDVEVATFGQGCFWCSEAVFDQLKGVLKVESGFSGGSVRNPTYVQITFDPKVISYSELLEVFWRSHDPTTPDRQGNDSGPQYRSVIFTHSEQQQALAERYKKKIDAAGVYGAPVVTEIVPFKAFYAADASHQAFFARNPRQGYCQMVIAPKVEKLRAVFRDKLKER